MPFTHEQAAELRSRKVRDSLGGFAPVWLVKDDFRPREDALVFQLVYQDPSYGWMNRRFKYDAFNDVLYHLGWRLLIEDETLSIQDTEPFIAGDVATHVPNAPFSRINSIGAGPR